MHRRVLLSCLIVTVICLGVVSGGEQAGAYTVRKAAYAGSFYPASANELKTCIDQFTRAAKASGVKVPKDRPLKALILPHAGYIYAGRTGAYAALALAGQHFSKAIVMGPDHRIGFMGASVSNADAYETPLGTVKCHSDARKLIKKGGAFGSVHASDISEHSVEVVLPYLQSCMGEFSLVPIVMGPGDIREYVKEIEPLLDGDTILVASSDLSHYLPRADAIAKDRQTLGMITRLDANGIISGNNTACGAIPIGIVIECARRKGWEPVILHYSTSGEAVCSNDPVVGYSAIAFYGGRHMGKMFTKEQGMALVELARTTIRENLGVQCTLSKPIADALQKDDFKSKAGVFVTLTLDGQLRGCIGSLESREAIIEGVKHNAVNAAFCDPRFRPLSKKELDRVHVEVSVLTDPVPMEYSDTKDMLSKLRPGVDGVIIRCGYATATFLPQVWEQLPCKEDFLSHLCMKAGLASDMWKTNKLQVLVYQVQCFEEEK